VVVFYKCRGFENKIEFLPLHIVVKKKEASTTYCGQEKRSLTSIAFMGLQLRL
jgi:hypothetical protein